MALTNQQRVGKALEILREGLGDFVAREFQSRFGSKSQAAAKDRLVTDRLRGNKPIQEWDVAALLRLVFNSWTKSIVRYLAEPNAPWSQGVAHHSQPLGTPGELFQ